MKTKSLLLVCVMTVGSYLVALAQTTPCDTYQPKVVEVPKLVNGSVDMVSGTVESWWSNVAAQVAERKNGWMCENFDPTVKPDISAQFKAVYDDENLYILSILGDNALVNISKQLEHFTKTEPDWSKWWECDNVELFFNADTASLDYSLASQVRAFVDENGSQYQNKLTGGGYATTYAEANPSAGFQVYTIKDGSNVIQKVKLPWVYVIPTDDDNKPILTPSEGKVIGYDYSYGDVREVGGNRAVIADWSTIWGRNFMSVKYFGLMKFKGQVEGGVAAPVIATKSISIYPNPAKDRIWVNTDMGGVVSVYDMMGKLVLKKSITNANSSLDISELPNGVYMLRYTDVNMNTFINKFNKIK